MGVQLRRVHGLQVDVQLLRSSLVDGRERRMSRQSKCQPETTFIYKCTTCKARNGVKQPPKDCMAPCWKCGFPTVQTLHSVRRK